MNSLHVGMSRMRGLIACAVLPCALAACSNTDESVSHASQDLSEIVEDLWQHSIEADPLARAGRGMLVTDLPDLSHQGALGEAAYQDSIRARLGAVDPAGLSPGERMTLDALLWETSMAAEGREFFWLEGFLTPYASPLRTLVLIFQALPLTTAEDAESYLALARKLPAFVNALEERARGQAERGIAVSAANLPNVVETWRAQGAGVETSLAWPAEGRTSTLPASVAQSFRDDLVRVLEEQVNPSFLSLAAYLEGPYAENAPEGVGLGQYDGGADYYRYLTRLHTTMDVSPEEVQAAGRELLAEFRLAMAEIRREVGFEGTREEFHDLLRHDPQFFPEAPEDVQRLLVEAADSMWTRIFDYFEVTQRAPYGARRLRPDLEPTMTYGYYNPPSAEDETGYYNFNGSSLDQRSWIGLASIGLHELIPGHHFQIARQMENEALPELRKNRRHTAFTEGWGSYSSFLGLEAGVYTDPYSRYGLYALESFLATRLVVDPGMNYFGMTLQEARAFMRENTLESETQIETESLRYSTDIQGQALAYQMGRRMFVELRTRAEERLGPEFDIRAFHEALLEHGSLPMVVLERRINDFLDAAATGGGAP